MTTEKYLALGAGYLPRLFAALSMLQLLVHNHRARGYLQHVSRPTLSTNAP